MGSSARKANNKFISKLYPTFIALWLQHSVQEESEFKASDRDRCFVSPSYVTFAGNAGQHGDQRSGSTNGPLGLGTRMVCDKSEFDGATFDKAWVTQIAETDLFTAALIDYMKQISQRREAQSPMHP